MLRAMKRNCGAEAVSWVPRKRRCASGCCIGGSGKNEHTYVSATQPSLHQWDNKYYYSLQLHPLFDYLRVASR